MQEKIRSLLTYFLTLTLIVLVATSCGRERHIAHDLENIAAVMEINPDSAYSMLGLIDSASLRGSNAALYILLDAQARHKLDLPIASDSAISIAVDFYASEGPDSMLMKSLFYRAVSLSIAKNYQSSIRDASSSFNKANKLDNDYWSAKNAEFIADLFSGTNNMNEDVKWRKIAADKYHKAARYDNELYSLCDLASTLGQVGDYQRSLQMFDSIGRVINKNFDNPDLKSYFYSSAIPIYTYFGDPDMAQSMIDSLHYYATDGLPMQYDLYQSKILLSGGDLDQARKFIDRARSSQMSLSDSALFYNELANFYIKSGELRNALACSDSVIALQYKLFHSSMAQEIATAQRDLYSDDLEDMTAYAQSSRRSFIISVFAIIILAVLAIGIIFFLRNRAKKNLEASIYDAFQLRSQLNQQQIMHGKLEDNIRSLEDDIKLQTEQLKKLESDYQCQLDTNNSVLNDLRKSIEETSALRNKLKVQIQAQKILIKGKWEPINILCKEFNNPDKKDEDSKERDKRLKEYLASLRNNEFTSEIEKTINLGLDNIMNRMRKQCVFFKEQDFIFFTLLYAGFNARAVAFFTNIKVKYFYTRRSRLLEILNNSEVPDKDFFLQNLTDS